MHALYLNTFQYKMICTNTATTGPWKRNNKLCNNIVSANISVNFNWINKDMTYDPIVPLELIGMVSCLSCAILNTWAENECKQFYVWTSLWRPPPPTKESVEKNKKENQQIILWIISEKCVKWTLTRNSESVLPSFLRHSCPL